MGEDHPNVLHGPRIPLEVPKLTVGQFIFARLKLHNPHDVLMVEAETGRAVTPAEFLRLSVRVAEGLKRRGLQRGDVVAIIGKAKIDVYATATGALFQGGTVCPLDYGLAADVFEGLLRTTAPRFVFCDGEVVGGVGEALSGVEGVRCVVVYGRGAGGEGFEGFLEGEGEVGGFRPEGSEDPGESVAFLVCSSGTMGTPKAVKISDGNLMYQAMVWGMITSFNKFFRCPAISFSYFFWISGVLVYLMVVCMEFEMTIVQRLEGRHVLEVIERRKPVWGMFSPALVKLLTWEAEFRKYDVSSLMVMITGGTSLQKVVVERVKELWGPQLSCRQSYGVTELTGSATAGGMGDDVLSVGRLLPGFHMKVVSLEDGRILGAGEEGELYVKSPSVMKGYLGNERATAEVLSDGWYRTGDVGKYTEKGLVYVTGRVKDFFRCRGVMVSPLEIEEVVLSVAGVADAGVVGVEVEEGERVPVALVVRAAGGAVTEEEVMRAVREGVSEGKRLGRVCFVESIPRTASGKMKRVELMERAKAAVGGA